ncbi:hypothetical protein V6N13_091277 [Hibiscus sabdariffa]
MLISRLLFDGGGAGRGVEEGDDGWCLGVMVVRRLESDLWGDHRCCLKRAELWCAAWQAGDHGEAGKGQLLGTMGAGCALGGS